MLFQLKLHLEHLPAMCSVFEADDARQAEINASQWFHVNVGQPMLARLTGYTVSEYKPGRYNPELGLFMSDVGRVIASVNDCAREREWHKDHVYSPPQLSTRN
jgi:hypothetical protein